MYKLYSTSLCETHWQNVLHMVEHNISTIHLLTLKTSSIIHPVKIYYILSKPAKQVWYWALRVYWDQFRVCVCMYLCMYVCMCNYSSQTTEPILKIIPANRASYADCYRLLRFEIFIKYDEYFVPESAPLLHRRIFATGTAAAYR